MKLGGSIAEPFSTPEEWGACLKRSRFAAVTCPVTCETPAAARGAYIAEAQRLGVIIAEVGVWRNTIAPDEAERKQALAYAKGQLALAEEIGANCCVNIVGSTGSRWDGAYAENYSADTYALIVDSIREIIDAVRPTRTYYSIEPMPWMVPDGPDEYLQLLKDVDRPRLGVHMDFVNMLNCPRRFLFAGDFIDECFRKLGPYIRSIHGKDAVLEAPFTSIIREVAPGKGTLNYRRILRTVNQLDPGMPFLLEHMDTAQAYDEAFAYVAGIAAEEGISIA